MCFVKNFHVGQFLRNTWGRPSHSFLPRSPPCSKRFKFLLLHKRQGAPMCSVKNFRVGQFSGPTWGAQTTFFSLQVATPLGAV